MKGFAQRIVLKQIHKVTRKWWLNGGLGSSPRIAVFSTELEARCGLSQVITQVITCRRLLSSWRKIDCI